MLSVHVKVKHSTGLPRYRAGDDMGYFKVESALHYRYAQMVAKGEALPDPDRDAQYPEGIRTHREVTTPMVYLTGWTWRLWPFKTPIDFRVFVILWVAVVSSLAIPALYLAALRLGADAPLAMAVTWVYGLSWAATGDFIGSYTFQCLALPLIFWSFACFVSALAPDPDAGGAGKRRAWACGAGLLMGLGLASWHVTRFYMAGFLLAAAWAFRSAERRKSVEAREALGILLAFSFLAGFVAPALRESRFMFSPAMVFGGCLLAFLYGGAKAAAAALGAGVLAFVASRQAPVEASAYSHVYVLLFDKLRFLLAKPADPAVLHAETRMFWMGPNNSPEPLFLVFNFVPLALIALPRLAAVFVKDRFPAGAVEGGSGAGKFGGWDLTDAMALVSAVGTALIARVAPFLSFFLCLSAARLRLVAGSRFRAAVLAGLALLAVAEGLRTSAPYSRLNVFMLLAAPLVDYDDHPMVSLGNERVVLQWLKERAGGRPVLAHISGPIVAYAGAPVLLNPKSESASSRRKGREFLDALFGGQDSFRAYCLRYGAGLFVYNTGFVLDESKDGSRYAFGRMRLSADQAAVLFHFHPERLRGFRLLYQNPDFRIFSVEPSTAGAAAKAAGIPPAFPRDPVYDIDQYAPRLSPDGTLALDVPGVLSRMKVHRAELFRARLMARMGQSEAAFEAYGRALAAWPAPGAARDEVERLSGRSAPLDAPR
jgi:hypothetical protein